MNEALRRRVRQRARRQCEYCHLPESASSIPFEIDHVIAKQHGGLSGFSNLALACFYCNSSKGPNVGGIDPKTGKLVQLFHPRGHQWSRHFRWDGAYLIGKTAIGRATSHVLAINDPTAVALRESLMAEGRMSS